MQAQSAEYFNTLPGIEAICLTASVHKYQFVGKSTVFLPMPIAQKWNPFNLLAYFWRLYRNKKKLESLIDWADVVHYVYAPYWQGNTRVSYGYGNDVKYAKKRNKAIFIEWAGSDIRRPQVLSSINKHYSYALENGYEYASFESDERSLQSQKLFADVKAVPVLAPEMQMYVYQDLFSEIKLLFQRWPVSDYKFTPPSITNTRPLILHSPTAKVTKGSNYIVKALEELSVEFDFEFLLLHNIPREEVLNKIQQCDIFIDQIILYGHGSAAMEAMSSGKPVVANIGTNLYEFGFPKSCPIVSANPDTIKSVLKRLLENATLRHEIGIASRAYMEEFHETKKVSAILLDYYKEELEKKKNEKY